MRLVHWAAVDAVQVLPVDTKLRTDHGRISATAAARTSKAAAARELLPLD